MLTLKLVGLAFEINSSYLLRRSKGTEKTIEERLEDESNEINPNFIEILHYTFNYIGVLTGRITYYCYCFLLIKVFYRSILPVQNF